MYETKAYVVRQFKKGDWKDDNDNYWCDMALEGVGEPIRIAVKDPAQFHDGMNLYGTIELAKSRAGKEYLKFKRIKKEESSTGEPTGQWQAETPERQDSINRSVALNNAAVVFQGTGAGIDQIVVYADKFYTWLTHTTPQPKMIVTNTTVDEIHEITGEPISLDDIPEGF